MTDQEILVYVFKLKELTTRRGRAKNLEAVTFWKPDFRLEKWLGDHYFSFKTLIRAFDLLKQVHVLPYSIFRKENT